MRRVVSVGVCAALLAFAGCAAQRGEPSSTPSDSRVTSSGQSLGSIEVPDVTSEDGADAVSGVEAEGLIATLADASDDPFFDTSRDATGCQVTGQDPVGGELVSEGDEVTITIDCSQVDWEIQEGAAWEAFNDAYTSGFDDGCHQLFDSSPTGSLFEAGFEYSTLDCENLNPGDASEGSNVPTDVPTDPQASGSELGELDGCQALFEQEGVTSLNYGGDSITEDDCPVAGSAALPPAPVKRSKSKSGGNRPAGPSAGGVKQAGETCFGSKADGTPLALQVQKGQINCAGAVALLSEWLRRAPHEAVGSSGALSLYGWDCAGATAAEAPRVGACSKTDGSAEFTAFDGE